MKKRTVAMLAIVIAPFLGCWGIPFFLERMWAKGLGCVAVTVVCYVLAYITKSSWPFSVPFFLGLLSSVYLFSRRSGISLLSAVTRAPVVMQVYWGVFAVLCACMMFIPFDELLQYY